MESGLFTSRCQDSVMPESRWCWQLRDSCGGHAAPSSCRAWVEPPSLEFWGTKGRMSAQSLQPRGSAQEAI